MSAVLQEVREVKDLPAVREHLGNHTPGEHSEDQHICAEPTATWPYRGRMVQRESCMRAAEALGC